MVFHREKKSRICIQRLKLFVVAIFMFAIASCDHQEVETEFLNSLKHPLKVSSNSKGLFFTLKVDDRLSVVNFLPDEEEAHILSEGLLDSFSPEVCGSNIFYLEVSPSGINLVHSKFDELSSQVRYGLESINYYPDIYCEKVYFLKRSIWDVETHVRLYSLDLSNGSEEFLEKKSLLSPLDVDRDGLYYSYSNINGTTFSKLSLDDEEENIFTFPESLYAHDYDADSELLVFSQTDNSYFTSAIKIFDHATQTTSILYKGNFVSSLNFGENGEIVALITNRERIPVSILYFGKSEEGYDQPRKFDLEDILDLIR